MQGTMQLLLLQQYYKVLHSLSVNYWYALHREFIAWMNVISFFIRYYYTRRDKDTAKRYVVENLSCFYHWVWVIVCLFFFYFVCCTNFRDWEKGNSMNTSFLIDEFRKNFIAWSTLKWICLETKKLFKPWFNFIPFSGLFWIDIYSIGRGYVFTHT